MDFESFCELVPKLTNLVLPGESSHLKMSPPERAERMRMIDFSKVNPRRAAVLVLVYPDDGKATLALIRRNSYKGVHSSQVAFPGGKIESFDATPLAAALREANEEIGINAAQVKIICALSDVYIPPSNFCVSPFLAYCSAKPNFKPDPREVAGMIALRLSSLLDPAQVSVIDMPTSFSDMARVPVFTAGSDAVWGATAMMLSELKDVLIHAAVS